MSKSMGPPLKAAFSPPPGPPPLFWPRLSCKKMPAAFSANWAASPPREDELGEASFFRRKIFAQFKIIQERRSPIQIEARQGFAHIKGVCGWMGMGPRGRGRGRTTIHPFREGFASPKRCKTASDLPTTRDPRRDRS